MSGSTGSVRRTCACRSRFSRPPWTSSTPDLRAALEESIRRARIVHADQRRTDTTTEVVPGGTVTERWVPVDRVGLYVPGRARGLPEQRRHERRARPARRGRLARRRVAAAARERRRLRRVPQPDHPRHLRAARRRRGLRGRRRPGGRDVRVRLRRRRATVSSTACPSRASRCRWSPVRATSGSSQPSGCSRGSSASMPRPGPTEIAILADSSADAEHVAADLVSQAEHDPLAASVLVTDSEELAEAVAQALARRVPATKHAERVASRLARHAVPHRARRRRGCRSGRRQRLCRRAPRDPDARRQRRGRGVRNAGAVFVGPLCAGEPR